MNRTERVLDQLEDRLDDGSLFSDAVRFPNVVVKSEDAPVTEDVLRATLFDARHDDPATDVYPPEGDSNTYCIERTVADGTPEDGRLPEDAGRVHIVIEANVIKGDVADVVVETERWDPDPDYRPECCECRMADESPCHYCFVRGFNRPNPTPPITDGSTITTAHLSPDGDGAFYAGQERIMEGRVLYDTDGERFCGVYSVNPAERVVSIVPLAKSPNGPYEIRHGTFDTDGEEEAVEWADEGGRFIPK